MLRKIFLLRSLAYSLQKKIQSQFSSESSSNGTIAPNLKRAKGATKLARRSNKVISEDIGFNILGVGYNLHMVSHFPNSKYSSFRPSPSSALQIV